MRIHDRIKRAIAFYFSLALFFVSLPILLSYSLGYHIDYNNFKIYKTGIIFVNSSPSGAVIYINGKKCDNPTPARIEELKPGMYRVEVRREGFYSWESEAEVRPNMVARLDKIVLFPITQEMKQICERDIINFIVSDNKSIYYMTRSGLFRSDMDGTGLRRISLYSNWPDRIIGKRFSTDGKKLVYFTKSEVYIAYLDIQKTAVEDEIKSRVKVEGVFTSSETIVDAFWYSSSDYITVVTEKDIEAVELRGGGKRNIVTLYKFSSAPKDLYYDESNDSLYFTDSKKEAGKNYLYRLDLRQKFLDYLKELLYLKKQAEGAGNEK